METNYKSYDAGMNTVLSTRKSINNATRCVKSTTRHLVRNTKHVVVSTKSFVQGMAHGLKFKPNRQALTLFEPE